jgi:C2H2-type zinc finger
MTIAIPQRPAATVQRLYWALVALPWHAIKTYPPVFLLASAAAYASSEFAAHHSVFPFPFNIMQAVAFEYVYLGAIALASTQRSFWFYSTVLSGAITSMLYIFLHSADKYGLLDQASGNVWLFLFSLAHAVPLTLVGVSYMFLFHAHTRQLDEETRRVAHKCPVCGKGFGSQSALDGHSRIHKP